MLLKHKPTREQNPLDSVVPRVAASSVDLATQTPCGVAGVVVIVVGSTAGVIAIGLPIGSVATINLFVLHAFTSSVQNILWNGKDLYILRIY